MITFKLMQIWVYIIEIGEYNYGIKMNIEANSAVNSAAIEAARIFSQKVKPVEVQVLDEQDVNRFGLNGDPLFAGQASNIDGQLDRCTPDHYDDGHCFYGALNALPQVLIDNAGGFCILAESKDPVWNQPDGQHYIGLADGIKGRNDAGGKDMCENETIYYTKGLSTENHYIVTEVPKAPAEDTFGRDSSQLTLDEQDPVIGNSFVEAGAFNMWSDDIWQQGVTNEALRGLVEISQILNEDGTPKKDVLKVEFSRGPEYLLEIQPDTNAPEEVDRSILEVDSGSIQVEGGFLTNQQTALVQGLVWEGKNIGIAIRNNSGWQVLVFENTNLSGQQNLKEFNPDLVQDFDPKNPPTVNDDGSFEQSLPANESKNNGNFLAGCMSAIVVVFAGVAAVIVRRRGGAEKVGKEIFDMSYSSVTNNRSNPN